ncbi:MAG: hypothetical protein Q7R74_01510 [bacterium]|nr:hypothetical protein [bacterium]
MTKNNPTLLVDVGSANVGVAILETPKEGSPILSRVRRTALQNVSGENTAAIATLALDALKKSLEGLASVSPAPKTAHIVLAAPWYKARIKTINLRSEKPLRITKETVEKALRDYRNKQTEPVSAAVRQVESAVSQTYVNGYPTTLEKPLHGKTLTANLYESEADLPFLTGIEEAVRGTFSGIRTTFHSFPFVTFLVLRDLKDVQSFVIADIGGEITDLAVISRDSLSFIGSFPSGTLTLLRALAGKGSAADAASRLTLYVQGELSAEEKASFSSVFEKAVASWNLEYQKLLEIATLEMPVSNTVFLFADKEELRWFEQIFTSAKTAFPVRPILVTPDFFQNAITIGEEGRYDAFLSIAALYSSRHG